MFFIEINRDGRKHAPQVIEKQVAPESQPSFEDAKPSRPIREILERVLDEIVKTVKAKVVNVGGVGIRVRRAVVRCCNDNFGSGLGDPMHLGHSAQDVRLVFEKMGEVDAISTAVAQRPGEMRKLAENIRRRPSLPVKADCAGLLLLFAAADVEDDHS